MANSFNPIQTRDLISEIILNESVEKIWNFPEIKGDFISTGNINNDHFESTLDGDPVLKSYNNFTINEGHTVTTTNRCKGLYIFVKDTLTVNGTLSMTAKRQQRSRKIYPVYFLS